MPKISRKSPTRSATGDLRHSSHMWIVDEALAKMNAELPHRSAKVPSAPEGGVDTAARQCL